MRFAFSTVFFLSISDKQHMAQNMADITPPYAATPLQIFTLICYKCGLLKGYRTFEMTSKNVKLTV